MFGPQGVIVKVDTSVIVNVKVVVIVIMIVNANMNVFKYALRKLTSFGWHLVGCIVHNAYNANKDGAKLLKRGKELGYSACRAYHVEVHRKSR